MTTRELIDRMREQAEAERRAHLARLLAKHQN